MTQITRRDFLSGLTAVAGATLLADQFALAAETQPAVKAETKAEAKVKVKLGSDVVKLGKTSLQPTLLGLGTGTNNGAVQKRLGNEGFTKFVRHALDRGIRYIDTADAYGTHSYVSQALEGVARDKYFIQTKMMASRVRTADQVKSNIEKYLKDLKTDYVDTLLMHLMTAKTWPTDLRLVMDAYREAKEKGQIKACGISMHSLDALVAASETDWVDTVLVRINPFTLNMDVPAEKMVPYVKKLHEKGCGVIGMKIFGETGLKSPEQRLESLRYVMNLGCVDCFTIGFGNIAQFDETMDLIEKAAVPA
jgi:predicted aldo/keto reductase-like oxidoreductase